jgi:long-subunit fatty acid transport protein
MMGFRQTMLLAGLALCALSPRVASAGPLDIYGAGEEDTAQGGAQTAGASGPWALHYNPGALTEARVGFNVGMMAAINNIDILLTQRPDGYGVPDLGGDSSARPTSVGAPPQDVQGLPPTYAVSFGGVTDFGLERLRLGAIVWLPTQSAVTMDTHYSDERERYSTNKLHYELLDKRLRRLDIQLGGAWTATDWLSIGVGGLIVPDATLTNDVTLRDAANQEDAEINLHADSGAGLGWTLGGLVKLGDKVRIGASWRSDVALELTGENRIQVLGTEDARGNPQVLVQQLSFVPSYTPARGAIGVNWIGKAFDVNVDAIYMRWSDYRDTHGARAGFEDTFNLRIGGKWRAHDRHTLMAGLGIEPTPVPDQIGRTNYVDNSRGVVSIGATHRVAIADTPLTVGWFARAHILATRITRKQIPDNPEACTSDTTALCDEVPDDTSDGRTGQPYPEAQGLQTGNPGFPGYTSGGWIGVVGFSVRKERREEAGEVKP